MEEAVQGVLRSIKQRRFDERSITEMLNAASLGNFAFKVRLLRPEECFVCGNAIGANPERLICGHNLCSPECLFTELSTKGPQKAVCRHCLLPITNEETKEKPKFLCEICTDEYLVENSITLSCNHRFCNDCITTHVENLLEEGKVESSQVKCPKPDCPMEITYNEAKNLLAPEQFDRLDNLMASKFEIDTAKERIV